MQNGQAVGSTVGLDEQNRKIFEGELQEGRAEGFWTTFYENGLPRWRGRRSDAWKSSTRITSPTQRGRLRRQIGRMSSCLRHWQGKQSGAWATSTRRTSPTRCGRSRRQSTTRRRRCSTRWRRRRCSGWSSSTRGISP